MSLPIKAVRGVDGIKTAQHKEHFPARKTQLLKEITEENYFPQPILGVEIPKGNGKNPPFGRSHHHRPSVATSRSTSDSTTIRTPIQRIQRWI